MADALHAFRDWTPDLSDELTAIVTFMTPPPSWELGDETLMIIGFAWAGTDGEEMNRVIAPLRRAVAANIEVLEPTTWAAWQSAADELFPKGVRAYWKNAALDELSDAAIDALVAGADAIAPRKVGIDIHHMGGAFGRVREDAHAIPEPWRRVLDQLLRRVGLTRWRRGRPRLGTRHARAGAAVRRRGRVRELSRFRHRRCGRRLRGPHRVRGSEAGAPPRPEAPLGSVQRLPPEPQYPARVTGSLTKDFGHDPVDRIGLLEEREVPVGGARTTRAWTDALT